MRRKLPWLLFAASLLLNICFIGGLLFSHFVGYHPGAGGWRNPIAEAVEEFSLDDRQAQALEALRERFDTHRSHRRGDREGFRTTIVDALRQPVFDRDALAEALQVRRGASGGMILDMAEDLHGFLAGLTPEQKEAFLERAGQRDFLRRLLFPRYPRRG